MQPAFDEPKLSRAEQNRINARKSTGPRTAEGKERSSLNSIKHGIYTAHVILPGESPDEFAKLLKAYIDQFQPTDQLESDLVQDIADARWRISRMKRQETLEWSQATFNASKDPVLAEAPYEVLHEYAHRACAQAKGNPLEKCRRAEARYRRDFERALKTLHDHRKRKAQQQNVQNEATTPYPVPIIPQKSQNEATATPPQPPQAPPPQPNYGLAMPAPAENLTSFFDFIDSPGR